MKVLIQQFLKNKQKNKGTHMAHEIRDFQYCSYDQDVDCGAKKFCTLTWKEIFPLLLHSYTK